MGEPTSAVTNAYTPTLLSKIYYSIVDHSQYDQTDGPRVEIPRTLKESNRLVLGEACMYARSNSHLTRTVVLGALRV